MTVVVVPVVVVPSPVAMMVFTVLMLTWVSVEMELATAGAAETPPRVS